MFANRPEDWVSIPGRDIPKTQKIIFDASLLNIQNLKLWVKGKWSNLGKGIELSLTPWCGSYWKGSLHVDTKFIGALTIIYHMICDERNHLNLAMAAFPQLTEEILAWILSGFFFSSKTFFACSITILLSQCNFFKIVDIPWF